MHHNSIFLSRNRKKFRLIFIDNMIHIFTLIFSLRLKIIEDKGQKTSLTGDTEQTISEHKISSTGDTEHKISSTRDTEHKISLTGDTEQKIYKHKIYLTGDTEQKISLEVKSQQENLHCSLKY